MINVSPMKNKKRIKMSGIDHAKRKQLRKDRKLSRSNARNNKSIMRCV